MCFFTRWANNGLPKPCFPFLRIVLTLTPSPSSFVNPPPPLSPFLNPEFHGLYYLLSCTFPESVVISPIIACRRDDFPLPTVPTITVSLPVMTDIVDEMKINTEKHMAAKY